MKEYTSQGLSQRLHDKGFKGEHVSNYCVFENGEAVLRLDRAYLSQPHKCIPAYTFTELWGVLPERIVNNHILEISKSKSEMWAGYYRSIDFHWEHWNCTKSPAEAVGLLVEWLIDNNHMEVKG